MSNTQNAVSIFNFENQQVDVLTDEQGNPWFIGKQVATILGYTVTDQAIRYHVDEEDKKTLTIDEIQTLQIKGFASPRGLTIINESGLYSLILKSQLPSAKKFKRWVTSEVLPSIRKTGSYTNPKANQFFIAGIHGYIADNGVAMFDVREVAKALNLICPQRKSKPPRWNRIAEILNNVEGLTDKDFCKQCDYITEKAFAGLVLTMKSKLARNLRETLFDDIIPQLQNRKGYYQQVDSEYLNNGNITLDFNQPKFTMLQVIRDIGTMADEIQEIFESTHAEALEKAIDLKEKELNIDLDTLRDLIPIDTGDDDDI